MPKSRSGGLAFKEGRKFLMSGFVSNMTSCKRVWNIEVINGQRLQGVTAF